MRVSGLAIYPVKGLRAVDVIEARVERQGLQHDRRWAVVRPDGRVWTQRDLPGMARVDAWPQAGGVRLEAAGSGGVDAVAEGAAVEMVVWGTAVPGVSAGEAANAWASRVLGAECRLVHQVDAGSRAVTPDLARPGDVVSLADGFPLLVTTEASLAAVNARLGSPVPMARFRPNLVIEGADAWDEDRWGFMKAGGVRLRLASPCARCVVTTLDQRTGAATARKEPLRTLGTMHRDGEGRITFGWNAVPEGVGVVRVGDAVTRSLQQ